ASREEDWGAMGGRDRGAREQAVVVAGLVVALRTITSQRGGRIAFVTLDDRSARLEVRLFDDDFQRYRDLLAKDRVLVVEGTVSVDEFSGGYRMSAKRVLDINQAREAFAKRLVIQVDKEASGNGFVPKLADLLIPFREG